jgi:hypothetical protein
MIVNHFGMRTDVQSYHLGGMGCSNGVVAVNLIKDLLKVSVCVCSQWHLTGAGALTPTAHPAAACCWKGFSRALR